MTPPRRTSIAPGAPPEPPSLNRPPAVVPAVMTRPSRAGTARTAMSAPGGWRASAPVKPGTSGAPISESVAASAMTSAAAAVQRAAVLPLESTAPPASGAPQRLAQRALRPKTLPSARGAQPAEADLWPLAPNPVVLKRIVSATAVQSPRGLKTAAGPHHGVPAAVPAHARGITIPVSTTEPAPNAPADPAGRRPGGLQWPGGTDRRCLA